MEQNHRMVSVGRNLGDDLIPTLCCGQGQHFLEQPLQVLWMVPHRTHPHTNPSALSGSHTVFKEALPAVLTPPVRLQTSTHRSPLCTFNPAEFSVQEQCLTSAEFNQRGTTFFGSDTPLSCIMLPNEGHLKPKTVSEHSTVLSFHHGLTKKNNTLSISRSQINLAIAVRK